MTKCKLEEVVYGVEEALSTCKHMLKLWKEVYEAVLERYKLLHKTDLIKEKIVLEMGPTYLLGGTFCSLMFVSNVVNKEEPDFWTGWQHLIEVLDSCILQSSVIEIQVCELKC